MHNKNIRVFAIALLTLFLSQGCERRRVTSDNDESLKMMSNSKESIKPEMAISARSRGDDILVEVIAVNKGTAPVHLLKWNLPDDGNLTTNLFEIRRDGQTVEYGGPMIKRSVGSGDYIDLKPGREYKAIVGLAQGYEVSSGGHYAIQYKAWNQTLDGKEVIELESNLFKFDK